MARQNIGQLVYTIEADDRPFTQALARTERAAASASTRTNTSFIQLERSSLRAQRTVLGLANATDLLGDRFTRVFSVGIRTVDFITQLGIVAARSSREVTALADAVGGLAVANAGASAAPVLGELVKRTDGGRFVSGGGSGLFRRSKSVGLERAVFEKNLAEAIDSSKSIPAISRINLALPTFAKGLDSVNKFATFAAVSLATFTRGVLKLAASPLGVGIIAIAGAWELYSYFADKATKADEARKKALDDLVESQKKLTEQLKESAKASRSIVLAGSGQSSAAAAVAEANLTRNPVAIARATGEARRQDLLAERRQHDKALEDARSGLLTARQRVADLTGPIQNEVGQTLQDRIQQLLEKNPALHARAIGGISSAEAQARAEFEPLVQPRQKALTAAKETARLAEEAVAVEETKAESLRRRIAANERQTAREVREASFRGGQISAFDPKSLGRNSRVIGLYGGQTPVERDQLTILRGILGVLEKIFSVRTGLSP